MDTPLSSEEKFSYRSMKHQIVSKIDPSGILNCKSLLSMLTADHPAPKASFKALRKGKCPNTIEG